MKHLYKDYKHLLNYYIRNGWDLLIGIVDRGPQEGLYKASVESKDEIIEVFDISPGLALKNLKEKLIVKHLGS